MFDRRNVGEAGFEYLFFLNDRKSVTVLRKKQRKNAQRGNRFGCAFFIRIIFDCPDISGGIKRAAGAVLFCAGSGRLLTIVVRYFSIALLPTITLI